MIVDRGLLEIQIFKLNSILNLNLSSSQEEALEGLLDMLGDIADSETDLLTIEFVIDVEPNFEDLRIVQRGKKQILQRFTEGNYALSDYWEDIKEVNFPQKK